MRARNRRSIAFFFVLGESRVRIEYYHTYVHHTHDKHLPVQTYSQLCLFLPNSLCNETSFTTFHGLFK